MTSNREAAESNLACAITNPRSAPHHIALGQVYALLDIADAIRESRGVAAANTRPRHVSDRNGDTWHLIEGDLYRRAKDERRELHAVLDEDLGPLTPIREAKAL